MKHFILMCDIVKSRQSQTNQLVQDFRLCTEFINKKFKDQILSPFTITLGDEFQGIVSDLPASVEIILALEEYLIEKTLKFRLRYVLHYGEIDTPVNSEIAYGMMGPGLTGAREMLNNLKGKRERFSIDIGDELKNSVLNNSFRIFQQITGKWRPEMDYTIVNAFLKFRDYKAVSEEIHRERSLVWKREKTLNITSYFSIREILTAISKLR